MAVTQETITLNTYGFEERRRTTSTGTKSRYTVSMKTDPIVAVFDPKELGRGPAEAMASAIKRGIQGITAIASPATRAFRVRAKKAYEAGAGWALKRYSGGRTGGKAPGGSSAVRLFNDSNRLSEGIFVGPTPDGWTINVPANRFDPDTFTGGVAALTAMVERLQALVPALRDPAELFKDPEVNQAIEDSIYDVLVNMDARVTAKRNALRKAISQRQLQLLKMGAQIFDLI